MVCSKPLRVLNVSVVYWLITARSTGMCKVKILFNWSLIDNQRTFCYFIALYFPYECENIISFSNGRFTCEKVDVYSCWPAWNVVIKVSIEFCMCIKTYYLYPDGASCTKNIPPSILKRRSNRKKENHFIMKLNNRT